MQTLNTAAAAVQAAHSKLHAHPLPAALIQYLGDIPPLQGVRMPEGSQQQHQQHQAHAKVPGEHAVYVAHNAPSPDSDSQMHVTSAALPSSTLDPVAIPLMRRVASIIEYLKTHVAQSDTSANSPAAVAVARLEHAMARAGVKDIDLRLGDSFQPNIHRVVAFTPLADIDEQVSEELEDVFYKPKGHIVIAASARGYKFGSTIVRRACVTVAAESESSVIIEATDAVDLNDDMADAVGAANSSIGKGSEFLGRLKSYSLSFKSAVAEKLSPLSVVSDNTMELSDVGSSDHVEHQRMNSSEGVVGESGSGGSSLMSSMMTKALQAAASVASDYRGTSAASSSSLPSGATVSAESLTTALTDTSNELRNLLTSSPLITTQIHQRITKIARVRLAGLLHEFLSIGFKNRRLMMSQTPWAYVESVCLKKSSESVIVFELASYIRAINDFKPFKDSSLHKLRGLVAACLASGTLGQMWRLLMQGDKSNYFNLGAPMFTTAQADAFLAAMQPVALLIINQPPIPIHLDVSPKDEDHIMETWPLAIATEDTAAETSPALIPVSLSQQAGGTEKSLVDDVLTHLD